MNYSIVTLIGLVLILASCGGCSPPKETLGEENGSDRISNATTKVSARGPAAGYQHRFAARSVVRARNKRSLEARGAVIINKRDFDSWSETGILAKNGKQRLFLIEPGDYRDWGALLLRYGGSAEEHLTLAYYDPKSANPFLERSHPVRLAENKRVIIENFNIRGGHSHPKGHPDRRSVATGFITLRGLTSSGRSLTGKSMGPDRNQVGGPPNTLEFAEHVLIENCLIEKVARRNALRIMGSENTIRRCVVRNCLRTPGTDNIAISFHPNASRWASNNLVENCEIYNCTDCVQISSHDDPMYLGRAPGTIFRNNDCYVTPEYYVQRGSETLASAEDGFDLKTGGTVEAPVIISHNTIRGMRRTDTKTGGSGGHGTAFNLHHYANHIVVEHNLIYDNRIGILNGSRDPELKAAKRGNIKVRNNLFRDMYRGDPEGGTVLSGSMGMQFTGNTVAGAHQLLNAGYRSKYLLENNLFADLRLAGKWSELHEGTARANVWVAPPAERFGGQARGDRVVEQAGRESVNFTVQPITAPRQLPLSVPKNN